MFTALHLWFKSCFISTSLCITGISTHLYGILTYLFLCEHVLIEIILNLFIYNVNVQLLKGILFEIFKAKYIQNANAQFITIPTEKLKRHYFELFIFLRGNIKQGISKDTCNLAKKLLLGQRVKIFLNWKYFPS